MNEYFPTVVQVIPLDNFHVQVFFDDGKIVDYDATEDLKAEIFKPFLSNLCEVSLYPDDESLFDWGIEEKVKDISEGIRKIVGYYNRNFGKAFLRLFLFAKDMIKRFDPTCIIYDYFDASWAKDAANACGVVSIASSPTYAINRALFLNKPSEFARYVWRIPLDSKITNTDQGIIKLAEHISRRICYEKKLNEFDLFEIGNSDYLNIIHTSRDLQPYVRCFNDKFLFVGCQIFGIDPISADFVSHLEKHPIIYFSLGSTIRSADKALMKICIDGLKTLNLSVIMSIGPYVEPQDIATDITDQFILNLFFYILITSILTTTLMKVAYAGESQMLVEDALNRMNSIMNVQPLPESKQIQVPSDASIDLENVSFTYQDASTKAIDNLSMHIKAGEHIALVGPSGGGKTTVASLISRFWDVNEGSIKIGHVDVKDIEQKELMNQVSYVFQDSRLLKMSILENIRMSRPEASDEEVIQALKDAQCQDIIDKFPDGVHTVIGSKGVYVSGGESQRLSIARAFLKNAPILILDEATAFADPDNEVLVQKAFEKLAKDKTVVMIAHRLSAITNADCIYVLENGHIVESGKHEELLETKGVYEHMWHQYNQSVKWKVQKGDEE